MPAASPATLTIALTGVGTLTLDLGNVATFSLAQPQTAPSWVIPQANTVCDFTNARYWANTTTSTLGALVGGSPTVSASGLRCQTTADVPTAIGPLANDINSPEGFLVAKISANLTNLGAGTYMRLYDINGFSRLTLDAFGVSDSSGAPRVVLSPDNVNETPSGVPYVTTTINTIAHSWGATGVSLVVNNATLVKGSYIARIFSTGQVPYLGNRSDAARPLGGFITYLATGSVRPTDTVLRAMAP